jgi:hypothetical protein
MTHLPARAGNRRFGRLSALRAHTKAPYKTDLHRKTLMALNRLDRDGADSPADRVEELAERVLQRERCQVIFSTPIIPY